jgi:hypothetical protein
MINNDEFLVMRLDLAGLAGVTVSIVTGWGKLNLAYPVESHVRSMLKRRVVWMPHNHDVPMTG